MYFACYGGVDYTVLEVGDSGVLGTVYQLFTDPLNAGAAGVVCAYGNGSTPNNFPNSSTGVPFAWIDPHLQFHGTPGLTLGQQVTFDIVENEAGVAYATNIQPV